MLLQCQTMLDLSQTYHLSRDLGGGSHVLGDGSVTLRRGSDALDGGSKLKRAGSQMRRDLASSSSFGGCEVVLRKTRLQMGP